MAQTLRLKPMWLLGTILLLSGSCSTEQRTPKPERKPRISQSEHAELKCAAVQPGLVLNNAP